MSYLEIDGHQVWHEMSGSGEPLVLLHGAFAGASSFGAQTPAFVDAGFAVFVPERRGHAHTPDVGQYYNSTGRTPNSQLEELIASPEAMGFLRTEYDLVSPDGPKHFAVVHAKITQMVATEPEIELSTLASVAVQTLVLQGDRDEVTVEHSLAVVAALPDARLAVLPGSHALPIEAPVAVNAVIISFLRDGPPTALWDALG